MLEDIRGNGQSNQEEIELQRKNIALLKKELDKEGTPEARELLSVADYLVKRSIWVLGGDGWAYDIGYGGLDHVMALGRNVNVLCLDTQVYSNTGGQMSKATPIGAIAKFAYGGKPMRRKELGLMLTTYGYIYVAQVAMGANKMQTVKAFIEAENYDGPSIVIAYSHCINHQINMVKGLDQQKMAVDSGMWTLFRYNPTLADEGKNPFVLDSKEPSIEVKEYMYSENRFRALRRSDPEAAEKLLAQAQKDARERHKRYSYLSDARV